MAPPTSTSLIYLMEQTKASTTHYKKKTHVTKFFKFQNKRPQ